MSSTHLPLLIQGSLFFFFKINHRKKNICPQKTVMEQQVLQWGKTVTKTN